MMNPPVVSAVPRQMVFKVCHSSLRGVTQTVYVVAASMTEAVELCSGHPHITAIISIEEIGECITKQADAQEVRS